MKTKTITEITDWPVLPVEETNRQRIIRALREADGVVPQIKHALDDENGGYCALGLLMDAGVRSHSWSAAGMEPCTPARIMGWNKRDSLTFRQIADRLEDDSYWNEHANDEFKDGS